MDIPQLLLNKSMPSATAESANVPVEGRPEAQTAEQLKAVARQFETVLLHQVVKQMQETVDYSSLDEEDESGEQIQSMYWSFMADAMGQQGGVGLWKSIYEGLAGEHGIDTRRFPPVESVLDERL